MGWELAEPKSLIRYCVQSIEQLRHIPFCLINLYKVGYLTSLDLECSVMSKEEYSVYSIIF